MLTYLILWLYSASWPFCDTLGHKSIQEPPCLSGIINHYTPVLGFGCDSSTLQVGTLTGFNAGDKVLLLQMQIPQVDLSNTASFGTVLNTTCIGNYEFNRIQSVGGNTIQLKFALTRPYDLSGKVQLVRVPEYDSAMVCGVTCLPWNGSVGGVLALDVKGQLTLSGNLDVSGTGFRGGIVESNNIPWVFGEQQYFYPPQSTLAAEKGEGIVSIPIDFSFGRGRAATGGGGGNAHNGGGGGGANAGSGGNGGLELSDFPAPGTPNTDGIGGLKYFENQTNKILLGGGAGAGHANDTRGTSGGNGGGIIFLATNTLQTNNFRALANGVDVFGGAEQNDGQGGGGGGGTVVLQIAQINGILNCELKGGRGGSNPYSQGFQLHGPGGGGGGGKLLLTQNSPNVVAALQGGINGLSTQNIPHGAMPGEAGKMLTGFILPAGAQPAHPVSNNLLLMVQSPFCSGMQNGQISILHSTALAFRLNGGTWQSDSVFFNLGPGTYQIGLQFSGGCTLDTTAFLNTPAPALDSLLLLSDAGCTSGGVISVAAVSGTAPFEFQVNGGAWQPNGLFSGLSTGNYSVTLRDALGCTHTSNYSVNGTPPAQDSLMSLVGTTCVAGGEILVDAVSGTAPFEYQINGGPWQPSGTFSNLPAGNYSITMRDAAGCTHTDDYVVNLPPPAQDTLVSIVSATCVAGGAVSVNAVSGTQAFEYQINGGPWQPSGTFSNLPAGNYSITMRDAAGCTHTDDYVVNLPPSAQDTLVSITNATCVAGGTVSVNAVSGTQSFEYQINGGPWQPSGTFSNLPAGNYSITMRDAAGCTHTDDYVVGLPPLALDTLVSIVSATCVAGGAVSVNAVSGTQSFEYQINGGPWQPSGTFSNLPAGNYSITMRDAAGCTHTDDYVVNLPPPAQDTLVSIVSATCVAGGAVSVNAVSGTQAFEYQINGGPWQPSGTFSNLPAGNYSITMRDAAGCTHTDDYVVDLPPPAQDTLVSIVSATCVAGGAVSVNAVSGTQAFEFQINGGAWQPGGTFSNLPAGNYSITMRDAAGCIHTDDYVVDLPPPALDSLVSLVNTTCVSKGSISLAPISGTAPFEFQVNGGPWQPSGMFLDLPAGNYSITMRDAAGCIHTDDYVVDLPPPALDTLVSLVNTTCVSKGSISLAPISGTAPFEFQVNSGPWQPSGMFLDLPAGNYSITMRDAAGCIHTDDYVVDLPPPALDSLVSITDATCVTSGMVSVNAVSGTVPFEFQINGGAWQSSGTFSNLPAGNYSITLRDAAGCTHLSSFQIQAEEPLLLQLDSIGNVDCQHPFGFVAVSATGGSNGYAYQIDNGAVPNPIGVFPALTAGAYTVTVRDSLGCEAALHDLKVTDLTDSAQTQETVTIYEGTFFELPDGKRTAAPGQYPFHYETVKGCDSLHLINLIVLKRHIYVPNVFLPNDDGGNDFFTVYADASLENVPRLAVYDRWGELVFEKENLQPNDEQHGWDGLFRGRPVNPGVFVWVVQLKFKDGVAFSISGNVTVVR